MAALVKEGASTSSIAFDYPDTYIRYSRGIANLQFALRIPSFKSFRQIVVHVFHGPTGTLKTRRAIDCLSQLHENRCFKWELTESTEWWDGYEGEEGVLLDEFPGSTTYRRTLHLLDGYSLRLPVKHGHTYANYLTVIITSDRNVSDWFPQEMNITELERRINGLIVDTSVKQIDVSEVVEATQRARSMYENNNDVVTNEN